MPVETPAGPEIDVARAMRAAGEQMNDYRLIDVNTPASARTYTAVRDRRLNRRLGPSDTLAMHWIDRDWLRRQLLQPFAGMTVGGGSKPG